MGELESEGGGGGVDLTSLVDIPADPGPEAVADDQPEAQPWQGISREDWESAQAQLQEQRAALEYLGGTLSAAEQGMQEQQAEEQYQADVAAYIGDPYDEGYDERVAEVQAQEAEVRAQQLATQMIEESLAPYQPLLKYMQQRAEQDVWETGKTRAEEIYTSAGVPAEDLQRVHQLANVLYAEKLKEGEKESPGLARQAAEEAAYLHSTRGGTLLDVVGRHVRTSTSEPARDSQGRFKAPLPPGMQAIVDRAFR